MLRRFTVEVETQGNCALVDLTPHIERRLADAPGVIDRGGVLHCFVVGSTAALSTVEYEPGLVGHDIKAALERIAPEAGRYEHEATWNDDNGHSHVRAAFIGPDLSIPYEAGGKLMCGRWQQVVLIDLDTRPRRRTVICTILG